MPLAILIDRSEADLAHTQLLLERKGVFDRILGFESVTQALAWLKKEPTKVADCIFLDAKLQDSPGIHFLDAFDTLRDRPSGIRHEARVVVLSEEQDSAHRDAYFSHQCVSAVLSKPVNARALSSLVRTFDESQGC